MLEEVCGEGGRGEWSRGDMLEVSGEGNMLEKGL